MSKALFASLSLLVGCTLTMTACTVSDTVIPDLAGPSGFANPLTISATPDNITEDGSQSVVVVNVSRPDGSPAAGVAVRLTLHVDGAPVDFGALNARTIYTDNSGKAATIYTAPMATAFFYGGPPKLVSILATPVGSNYTVSAEPSEHVTIKVTPPPVAVQIGGPRAAVTFTPAAPKVGQVVTFDASDSQPGAGQSNIDYFWDFGDGQAHDEHGVDASHTYSAPGTYTLVLGVIDSAGRIASTFRSITVVP